MATDNTKSPYNLEKLTSEEFITYLKTLVDPNFVTDMLSSNISLQEIIHDIAGDLLLSQETDADTSLLIEVYWYFADNCRWPWGFLSIEEVNHYKMRKRIEAKIEKDDE